MRWPILALLTFCAVGSAGVVEVTNFSCFVAGQNTTLSVSGSGPCGVGNNAFANIGFLSSTLPASLNPSTSFGASFEIFGEAGAGCTPGCGEPNLPASASASVSWSDTIATLGPMRPGIIILSSVGSVNTVDGHGLFDYQVGAIHLGIFGGTSPVCPPALAAICHPFELGTTFDVSMSAMASIFSLAGGGTGGGVDVGETLSFSLFEADGITPVQFLDTPEPASLALVATGLVFVIIRRRRRRV
jgi:PEP-CTERM motif